MNTNNLPKVFRWMGAGAIILSFIHFLIAGRFEVNSLEAHYLFLGVNSILAIAGHLCLKAFKERKTAKTFLALSITMIPGQFAQLGGLILSTTSNQISNVPELIKLTMPADSSLSLMIAASMITLVPIAFSGFKSFFEDKAKNLIPTFLLGTFILALPIRDLWFNMATITGLLILNLFTLKNRVPLQSFETTIAKIILFVPLLVFIGRSFFYSVPLMYINFIATVLGILSFTMARRLFKDRRNAEIFQAWSYLPFFISVMTLVIEFKLELEGLAYLSILVLLVTSKFSLSSGKLARMVAALIYLLVTFFVKEFVWTYSGLLCFFVGLIVLTVSIKNKEKVSFVTTVIAMGILLITTLTQYIYIPYLGTWQSLAIGGIILLVLSAVLERNYKSLKGVAFKFYDQLT